MATKGRRIDLSMLADDPPLEGARVPVGLTVSQGPPQSALIEQVASNPLNTRDSHLNPGKIDSIAESIKLNGQLQPCTVVSREAFLRVFAEHEPAIASAQFVQVTGARRKAALLQLGRDAITIHVQDSVADTRATFISATAAENIEREDYDLIEEARAVELLVRECGGQSSAAQQLTRTAGWVSQRLSLLKLEPELQSALRTGAIPFREVRHLHSLSRDEQLGALRAWRKIADSRDRSDESRQERSEATAGEKGRKTRRSAAAAAIYRLGGTPDRIATALRAEMSADDRRALGEALLADDE